MTTMQSGYIVFVALVVVVTVVAGVTRYTSHPMVEWRAAAEF
jgi:hypothetical protein